MKPYILFLSLALALCGCSKSVPASWEYETAEWMSDYSSVTIEISSVSADGQAENVRCFSPNELLNSMGERRWELVSVKTTPGLAAFYFKRPRLTARESYIFDYHFKKPEGK